MLALLYIILGSVVRGLSTPKLSVITGWFIATSRWNLQYADRTAIAAHVIAQVGLVLLWVMVLGSLVSELRVVVV